jgi:hypothetical protein
VVDRTGDLPYRTKPHIFPEPNKAKQSKLTLYKPLAYLKKVVKSFSNSCQKVVKKLSKNCQKVVKKIILKIGCEKTKILKRVGEEEEEEDGGEEGDL